MCSRIVPAGISYGSLWDADGVKKALVPGLNLGLSCEKCGMERFVGNVGFGRFENAMNFALQLKCPSCSTQLVPEYVIHFETKHVFEAIRKNESGLSSAQSSGVQETQGDAPYTWWSMIGWPTNEENDLHQVLLDCQPL
jgi:hypothetical protein